MTAELIAEARELASMRQRVGSDYAAPALLTRLADALEAAHARRMVHDPDNCAECRREAAVCADNPCLPSKEDG